MLFIGVMSGTSCDGADVVIVEFSEDDARTLKVVAAQTTPYHDSIKQPLLKLIANQPVPISTVSQLDAQLGVFYADVINELLKSHSIDKTQIRAIGLHGQTVCHQPSGFQSELVANTIQLGSATITAQRTDITTIANFRQMDLAYGGQGAPLAPALHQQLFSQVDKTVAVLNLGGIANVTILNGNDVIGFDTGPASCLMDEYIQIHRNLSFDESGHWARQGVVNEALLADLLADNYFKLAYPKSTGRELFNQLWLDKHLCNYELPVVDVQRTLLQLTVESVALGLNQTELTIDEMVVCGGGVHNTFLLHELQKYFNFKVNSSTVLGVDPDFVEAILMAWMGKLNITNQSLDLASVTGCEEAHVYGIQYKVNKSYGE